MIRHLFTPLLIVFISLGFSLKAQVTFSTTSLRLSRDEKGAISELTDIQNNVNYAATEPGGA